MKILVTGGMGYIGSVLVPLLLSKGFEVTVLDNAMYKQASLLGCCHSNLSLSIGDVRDHTLLKSLVKKNDIIVPLAAIVGMPACEMNRLLATEVNEDQISDIACMLSTDQLLILPNTNSQYGKSDTIVTENSPINPLSWYAQTKQNAEYTALAVDAVVFRLATVFGASPRMRTDLLVNDLVFKALNDKSIVVFQPNAKRNYIHVNDVCYGILHAINGKLKKGEVYNLGNDSINMSKLELVEYINKHIPVKIFIDKVTIDPDKRDYVVSSQKIYNTGFVTTFNLDYGITQLIKVFSMIKPHYQIGISNV